MNDSKKIKAKIKAKIKTKIKAKIKAKHNRYLETRIKMQNKILYNYK
jgi:hypothetical protein